VAACALPDAPDASAVDGAWEARNAERALKVDRPVFVARPDDSKNFWSFTVVARFKNPTADTVYLATLPIGTAPRACETPAHRLETVDSEHTSEHTDGLAYLGIEQSRPRCAPIAVPPGASRVDTLRFEGPQTWDGITGEIDGSLEGTMRLRAGGGLPWASEPFEVRTSEPASGRVR